MLTGAPWWLWYLDTPPGWPKPWEMDDEPFHPIWMARRTVYLNVLNRARADLAAMKARNKGDGK